VHKWAILQVYGALFFLLKELCNPGSLFLRTIATQINVLPREWPILVYDLYRNFEPGQAIEARAINLVSTDNFTYSFFQGLYMKIPLEQDRTMSMINVVILL